MAMNIDELKAHIAELEARIREIDEEFRNQALPADRQEEWDRVEGEREDAEKLLGELEYRRQRVEQLAGNPENREGESSGLNTPQVRRPGVARGDDIYDLSTIRSSVSGPQEATREMRDRAKVAIERAQFPHERAVREDAQAHIDRLLGRDDKYGTIAHRLLTTGNPTYERAFGKAIVGQHLSPEETRALSLTGEAGGYAVPFTLDPTVVPTSNGVVNPLRQISRVVNTTTDTWKGVSSAGTTAAYSAEAAETEDAEFKFAQPEISCERASALILASFEITQDWGSIQSEVAAAIQDAKDSLEAEKFLEGTGENQPYGVLKGAEETKETATKLAFAVADLYTIKGALPPRFRPNAKWAANDAQFDRVRQFDESGGADLWVQLEFDRPPQLLGKPAYELSTMNGTLEAEKLILLYGDFQYFVIAERIGMSIDVIPHVMNGKKATGQRGFYAFWRNGSKVLHKNAFRVLKVKKE